MSWLLPLAADPFPPTHVAGSEFEGFFIRLQSHSGRAASSAASYTLTSPKSAAASSPSKIPRLASHGQPETSAWSGPPSPTPSPRSDRVQPPPTMLTSAQPFLGNSALAVSPESYVSMLKQEANGKTAGPRMQLPTVAPGDLIVVICELQSAPVEQRICVYIRWIVHGEEAKQLEKCSAPQSETDDYVAQSGPTKRRGSKRPPNAVPSAAPSSGESFELATYIPKWNLKLGPKVGNKQVQPFRLDLPCPDNPGESYGFMSVTKHGNVTLDVTVPSNQNDGAPSGTRVRIRTNAHNPWCSPSSLFAKLPMGSRGPESLLQHLGLFLPLHWYVHTSGAPATFSVEHVEHGYAIKGHNETLDAVAAGRASFHHEKNHGQSFPTGWMWIQGASALHDASSSPKRPRTNEPVIRLMCAGGSTLGLTAFLIGIRVDSGELKIEWDFTPPFALGPGISFADGPTARVHYGIGFTIRRDYEHKTLEIQVWDYRRWARIFVHGDPHTFATQMPGPMPGGWAPGYCHQSYRCQASITLFERPLTSIPGSVISAASHPVRTLQSLTTLLSTRKPQHSTRDEAWCAATGWKRIGEFRLEDRVALEFGGDFAK